ncbi:MAG TPA: hypothetical protein PK869_11110 [Candidatus Hydrogenedentes bacterium]|nr:hypothetical protein [Candidatus Hydrogenedentota bacterium]
MVSHWHNSEIERALARRGLSPAKMKVWRWLHSRERFAMESFLDCRGEPWKVREYQRASLESFEDRKVHCDGRDVGKTTEIEIVTAWIMKLQPNTQVLIATQCDNHLFPLMNRLMRRFENDPSFANHIVEARRTPSWYLRFANGAMLWGRIAGPHGMNFQGLHVDWQIVDEAQEMTESSWGELYQALNAGGKRWVYGVPNGLRNTFYRMTQMPNVEQYRWPSTMNPDFDMAKDTELATLYGGRNSPGYIHRVLGEHGSPAHGVFDLDDYLACVDESVEFNDLSLKGADSFDAPSAPAGTYYLGCDLGYARDPSEFVVYRADPPHLINVLRVHLEGVSYARQQDVIVELDRAYNFARIGIDAGNSGRAVAHNLMARGNEWCRKIACIEFGGMIDLGPLPDGRPDRRPAKAFMTELLQREMRERTIVFPRLPDRESQYASHTYSIGTSSQVIFDKGNDHIVDADRCALYARHVDTQIYERPPNLGVPVHMF